MSETLLFKPLIHLGPGRLPATDPALENQAGDPIYNWLQQKKYFKNPFFIMKKLLKMGSPDWPSAGQKLIG